MQEQGLKIVATASALPKKIITNQDLEAMVETSDEWIVTRTGIRQRHQCQEETCTSLAIEAAQKALHRSGVDKEEIGAIIVATTTADQAFPSVACKIQRALELPEELVAFDINAACTGFLFAMQTAWGILQSSGKSFALVVASEELSRIIDYTDRNTCILFGDGAAAAVLTRGTGMYLQKSWCRGSLDALHCVGVGIPEAKIGMKGNDVFRFAVTALGHAIKELLQEAQLTMDDIDYVVCHQANRRIIEHVQNKFAEARDKFYMNIENYGNTSAASIPILINEMMEKQMLLPGKKILCVGFGAGLTWSGALLEL